MTATTNTGLVWSGTTKSVGVLQTKAWVLDERDKRVCQVCQGTATEVDHIWPRYWGGPDHVSNLRAICHPCNVRKGNRVDFRLATPSELTYGIGALFDRYSALWGETEELIYGLSIVTNELSRWRWLRDSLAYQATRLQLAADLATKRMAEITEMADA